MTEFSEKFSIIIIIYKLALETYVKIKNLINLWNIIVVLNIRNDKYVQIENCKFHYLVFY